MRVLHVVRSDGFAGVERYVSRLAVQQADSGDEVVVVGGDQRRMGIAVRTASGSLRQRRGDSLAQVVTALDRLAPGADVVHAHMTAAELGAAVVRFPWRRRTPVITSRHFASRRGTGRAGQAAGRVAGWVVDAQIAVSRFVAENVEGPSTVVYPGVDRQPDAAPATTRDRTILVVQRLEVEKDTALAVRAFAVSELAARGWRLQLAGEGARRGDLEQLAGELGVAHATEFLGSRDDVAVLMGRAALLLASAPAEPLGLSVVEAMSSGLPVVASASGGHLETLPSDAGMFAPGDVAAAATQLVGLARDPQQRDALARAGQDRQRSTFTLEAQVAGTRAVYLDQLSR